MAPDTPPLTAIVAAYNEGPRIATVLDVLTSYEGFDQVIVVDDGSTDDTAAVAAACGARVLTVSPNRGKGHAMDVGVDTARPGVVFFADADITGLTHEMIRATTTPVVEGRCDMFILMRNRKLYVLHRLMAFIPLLGGERALTMQLWQQLPERYKDRFRIEAGLNFYAIHHGGGLRYRVFPGISQTVKEAKFGLRDGLRRRLRMFADVIAAAWDLQWNDLPGPDRARRVAASGVVVTVAGMLLGLLLLAAGIAGPGRFFASLFAEELREDPSAPVARALLAIASGSTATVITAAGTLLLASNGAFFLRSLVRLVTVGRAREPA